MFKSVATFAAGIVVGGVAGYFVSKKVVQKKADAEIAEMREEYKTLVEEEDTREFDEVFEADPLEPTDGRKEELKPEDAVPYRQSQYQKPPIQSYAKQFQGKDRGEEEETMDERIVEIVENSDPQEEPHIIPPSAVGDFDWYSTYEWTMYADEVLTNSEGEPMDDDEIHDIIGLGSLHRMGEFEPNMLYVRNDQLQADIIITKDVQAYSDVMGPLFDD